MFLLLEGCTYHEFEEGTGFVEGTVHEGFAAGGGDAWWLPRECPLILQMQEGRQVSVIKGEGVRAPSDPTTTTDTSFSWAPQLAGQHKI